MLDLVVVVRGVLLLVGGFLLLSFLLSVSISRLLSLLLLHFPNRDFSFSSSFFGLHGPY